MIDLNAIAAVKTRHDLAAVKERLACTAADWLPTAPTSSTSGVNRLGRGPTASTPTSKPHAWCR